MSLSPHGGCVVGIPTTIIGAGVDVSPTVVVVVVVASDVSEKQDRELYSLNIIILHISNI